uniref:Cytochrome c oxidase assembly protein n=1 Tax=Kalanchoe fedtschenkoi TaxID=63787 RepID=A0A7N0UY25_KALFE
MSIHKFLRSGLWFPSFKIVIPECRVIQGSASSRFYSALHYDVNGSALRKHAWSTLARHGYRTESFVKRDHLPSATTQCFGRSPLLILQRQYAAQAATSTERKSKKMLQYLTALVFAMVGLTYAAVPMYRRFCQATGYGGTVQRRESVEEKIARHEKDGTVASREITVLFNADVADGMQWKFIPTQREVRVKPGESALAFYTAENRSSVPITGVSTYNVTPMRAAVYFNKIQCFCFEEQRLLPGEEVDMPVFFYIDPEFETDPRMDGINNIILSYTFFKVAEE